MTTTIELPSWAQPDTDLSGKTVLVIGGAGGVGEGITRALLDAGAAVIATARTQAKLDDLAERIDDANLTTLRLDLTGPDLDDTLAALVDRHGRHGRLDGVVVSVADWGRQGPKGILDLTDAEWEALVEQNQTTVFRAYRALVPALAPEGAIVHINGFSAEIPYPANGVMALTAAATKSMVRTIAEELKGAGLRVYEVILGVIRTRPRQLAGIDNPRWIPAVEVGMHTAELVAGNSPLAESALQYFVTREAGPSLTPPEMP
ncbi:SDR family oxidoreductase [Nonomuraea sp. CA-143628]|uniref:SDR family oxidoreductase n=1 Tax=Nonomuraea sp. CA-143628 TaxID=3239997 RepID=UPI003D94A3B7